MLTITNFSTKTEYRPLQLGNYKFQLLDMELVEVTNRFNEQGTEVHITGDVLDIDTEEVIRPYIDKIRFDNQFDMFKRNVRQQLNVDCSEQELKNIIITKQPIVNISYSKYISKEGNTNINFNYFNLDENKLVKIEQPEQQTTTTQNAAKNEEDLF